MSASTVLERKNLWATWSLPLQQNAHLQMIVSQQKPLEEILTEIEGVSKLFLIGCAKCATVCKAGGEEEVWQIQENLSSNGREVTGSMVIDEVCHMLRTAR